MQFAVLSRNLLGALALSLVLAACASDDATTSSADGPNVASASTTGVDSNRVPPPPGSYEEFVEMAGDRVFFGFDRYDLSAQAQRTLSEQADWLKANPGKGLVIEGHADERGTREYNLALGARRAQAARDYLVALGVESSRIRTISYGKERLAVVGTTERAHAQNRRAVTVFN